MGFVFNYTTLQSLYIQIDKLFQVNLQISSNLLWYIKTMITVESYT